MDARKSIYQSKGKLTDASSQYIHFASTGWWNSINADDMDGDGDLDLIIGNCGLNTQFHVNEKEPMSIYYKDFDGNGSIDPVLCYYIGGVSYPVNSRDDLTESAARAKEKFLEYKAYSVATINDIFPPEQLKDAGLLKAETMQTVYLENQGSKGFSLHTLPLPAQYSPCVWNCNNRHKRRWQKDILLTGNNSVDKNKNLAVTAPIMEWMLLGDGKGDFTYAAQTESGLNIRGNVRSLQKIKTGKSKSIIAGINDGNALLFAGEVTTINYTVLVG